MSPKKSSERRKHKRLAKNIPVELAIFPINVENKNIHKTTTLNVSCAGFYCKVDKYIPPFTKVEVVFLKNGQDNQKANSKQKPTTIQGVVVRTEPEKENESCHEYYIAIFSPNGVFIIFVWL